MTEKVIKIARHELDYIWNFLYISIPEGMSNSEWVEAESLKNAPMLLKRFRKPRLWWEQYVPNLGCYQWHYILT